MPTRSQKARIPCLTRSGRGQPMTCQGSNEQASKQPTCHLKDEHVGDLAIRTGAQLVELRADPLCDSERKDASRAEVAVASELLRKPVLRGPFHLINTPQP